MGFAGETQGKNTGYADKDVKMDRRGDKIGLSKELGTLEAHWDRRELRIW